MYKGWLPVIQSLSLLAGVQAGVVGLKIKDTMLERREMLSLTLDSFNPSTLLFTETRREIATVKAKLVFVVQI